MKDPAKKYTVSEGEILAAAEADEVIGIIAYHKHSKVHCEMKRFYVKPERSGRKLGEQLIKEILEHTKQTGYKEIVLDMIVPLQSAIHLLQKIGLPGVRAIL